MVGGPNEGGAVVEAGEGEEKRHVLVEVGSPGFCACALCPSFPRAGGWVSLACALDPGSDGRGTTSAAGAESRLAQGLMIAGVAGLDESGWEGGREAAL